MPFLKDIKPYRILVVEDNPGDLLLIEDFLKDEISLPVIHHASNFKAASAFINSTSP